jgi:hypothetical protein
MKTYIVATFYNKVIKWIDDECAIEMRKQMLKSHQERIAKKGHSRIYNMVFLVK